MSAANAESRRPCQECMTGTPEEDLCGWCLLDLNEQRAGRALLQIAIEEGEHDPNGEGVQEEPQSVGRLMIFAMMNNRCPEELVEALDYAGFTRGPGIADLTEEQRQERVAAAVEMAAATCPDDLGHVPGPGRPI